MRSKYIAKQVNGPEKDLCVCETSRQSAYFLAAAFLGVFAFLGLAAAFAFFGDLAAAFLGLAAAFLGVFAFFAAGFLAAAAFLGLAAAAFLAAGFLAAGFFLGVLAFFGLAAFGLVAFFAGLGTVPILKEPEAPVPLAG